MRRNLENPVTGDRLTFLCSPMLGDGEMLAFRCTLPPHGEGAPDHVHDEMTETFAVEHGRLSLRIDGRPVLLGPGEMIRIAAGIPHSFANATDEPCTFVTTATPGIGLERFLRTMYALAAAGETGATGAPRNPLALLGALDRIDMNLRPLPRLLQRGLLAVGRPLRRATGVDGRLSQLVEAN